MKTTLILLSAIFGSLSAAPLHGQDFYRRSKDFSVQQQVALSRPLAVSSTEAEKLFKRLHDETSLNDTFKAQNYYEVRKHLVSKIDLVDGAGGKGVRDLYSGTFMSGNYWLPGCMRECSDANGDGRVDIFDLNKDDTEFCKAGEYVQGRPFTTCKGKAKDLNGDGEKGDFINIEHLWPKSHFNYEDDIVGDLHNLRPAFAAPNKARLSKPFAPSGPSIDPKMRGDVARAAFYFALTYYNRIPSRLGRDFFTNSVPALMRWNKEDPPDEYEKRRNALAAEIQGNTNPFVEHPEYIDQIGQQIWQSLFRR